MNETEDCCLRAEGMCHHHARAILPQLAQPHWYRLVQNSEMTRSEEPPTLVRSRQAYERRMKLRRYNKLLAAIRKAA